MLPWGNSKSGWKCVPSPYDPPQDGFLTSKAVIIFSAPFVSIQDFRRRVINPLNSMVLFVSHFYSSFSSPFLLHTHQRLDSTTVATQLTSHQHHGHYPTNRSPHPSLLIPQSCRLSLSLLRQSRLVHSIRQQTLAFPREGPILPRRPPRSPPSLLPFRPRIALFPVRKTTPSRPRMYTAHHHGSPRLGPCTWTKVRMCD